MSLYLPAFITGSFFSWLLCPFNIFPSFAVIWSCFEHFLSFGYYEILKASLMYFSGSVLKSAISPRRRGCFNGFRSQDLSTWCAHCYCGTVTKSPLCWKNKEIYIYIWNIHIYTHTQYIHTVYYTTCLNISVSIYI